MMRSIVQSKTPLQKKALGFRSVGGSWSLSIAGELLKNRGLLAGDLDPATFSHEQVAKTIQQLDRMELPANVTASAIRYDIEWILWDRDGWRHRTPDRHERRA